MEIIKFENFEQLNESKKPESKFEIGDKVFYIPKISGLDPKKEFTISHKNWQENDELSKSFGVKSKPTWIYSFEELPLIAVEKDIKPVK